MEQAEQAKGERRVRKGLIEPLERLGLARPTTLTKVQYQVMIADLCGKLAYMSDGNLAALADQVAANPGGKAEDRLPIANTILKWAADIQPPSDSASPLVRAVFASGIGLDAVEGGWAPELFLHVKQVRKWPGRYTLNAVRERAGDALRRFEDLNLRFSRGDALSESESQWRVRRMMAISRCREISELGKNGAAA